MAAGQEVCQRRTKYRSTAGAPSCLPITNRPTPSAGPDRQRRRVVDEVLVSGEPILGVVRQTVRRLLVASDRSGYRDVGLGQGDPNRNAETEDRVEEAQHPAK